MTHVETDFVIFCKMYVACQSWEGDVEDFFAHENNSYPPSISEFGQLWKAKNKREILT